MKQTRTTKLNTLFTYIFLCCFPLFSLLIILSIFDVTTTTAKKQLTCEIECASDNIHTLPTFSNFTYIKPSKKHTLFINPKPRCRSTLVNPCFIIYKMRFYVVFKACLLHFLQFLCCCRAHLLRIAHCGY